MGREVEKMRNKRHRLMERLARREGLIHGSIVHTLKKCGRKQCLCEKGNLHPHIYLSRSVRGKNRIVYLSKKEAKKITSHIKAYREVMQLLEAISDINIQMLKLKEDKSRREHVSNR